MSEKPYVSVYVSTLMSDLTPLRYEEIKTAFCAGFEASSDPAVRTSAQNLLAAMEAFVDETEQDVRAAMTTSFSGAEADEHLTSHITQSIEEVAHYARTKAQRLVCATLISSPLMAAYVDLTVNRPTH